MRAILARFNNAGRGNDIRARGLLMCGLIVVGNAHPTDYGDRSTLSDRYFLAQSNPD
jgi:hypothetical protein